MRKARVALRAASPASCTRCCGTKPSSHRLRLSNPSRQETASSSRKERRPRVGADDGADCVAPAPPPADCVFNLAALHPAYPIKRRRARREDRHPKASKAEKSSPLLAAERTAIVSEGRIPDLPWRPCGPGVRDKVGVRVRNVSNQWRLWRRSAFIVPAAPPCGGHRRCATSPWGYVSWSCYPSGEPHPSHHLGYALPRRELAGFAHERRRPRAKPSRCRRWP
jgi:hypothetical protein